ncbi:unnamed protein product, partial [Prorocentrum cordatum]
AVLASGKPRQLAAGARARAPAGAGRGLRGRAAWSAGWAARLSRRPSGDSAASGRGSPPSSSPRGSASRAAGRRRTSWRRRAQGLPGVGEDQGPRRDPPARRARGLPQARRAAAPGVLRGAVAPLLAHGGPGETTRQADCGGLPRRHGRARAGKLAALAISGEGDVGFGALSGRSGGAAEAPHERQAELQAASARGSGQPRPPAGCLPRVASLGRASMMSLQVDPEDAARSASSRIPIAEFPRLPDRGQGFWSEPWFGACIVSVLSAVLVSITHAVNSSRISEAGPEDDTTLTKTLLGLIWAEAVTAVLATLYIVFAGAGVIKRSPDTCYPMPVEVEERLRRRETTEGMENIKGNSQRGLPDGTYCVRCLVWRQKDRGLRRGGVVHPVVHRSPREAAKGVYTMIPYTPGEESPPLQHLPEVCHRFRPPLRRVRAMHCAPAPGVGGCSSLLTLPRSMHLEHVAFG